MYTADRVSLLPWKIPQKVEGRTWKNLKYWLNLFCFQCKDKGTTFTGTGSDGLSATLAKQTSHGGFVRQAESPSVLKVKEQMRPWTSCYLHYINWNFTASRMRVRTQQMRQIRESPFPGQKNGLLRMLTFNMWDFSHAYLSLSMHSLCQDDEDAKYPIVGQLQRQLHKGIWAHFHFLDAAFPKFSEGKDMTVHIISQCLCNSERLGHLRLNLQKDSRERRSVRLWWFSLVWVLREHCWMLVCVWSDMRKFHFGVEYPFKNTSTMCYNKDFKWIVTDIFTV